jgi:hypothetical protein
VLDFLTRCRLLITYANVPIWITSALPTIRELSDEKRVYQQAWYRRHPRRHLRFGDALSSELNFVGLQLLRFYKLALTGVIHIIQSAG